MRVVVGACLGLLAVSSFACLGATAAEAATAQSKSCWRRATAQGLHGAERRRFHADCVKGSLSPSEPTRPVPRTAAAMALTEPSGADRTERSRQCDAEAAKRGFHDSGLQAFRKSCLASAAPVDAIGVADQPPRPTKADAKLDALTAAKPQ